MQKRPSTYAAIIATGLMLLGSAIAQQTASPKPKSSSAGAQKSAAPKAQPTPSKASPQAMELTTDKQKASYAVGVNIGKSMLRDNADIDPDVFAQGLKDALTGKPRMTEDEVKAALTKLQADLRAKEEQKAQAAAQKNKQEGDAFLAANKSKEGVVTLPSGLQYKVLTPGTGPKPTADDSVVCNYRGTLIDGTEFDSSYKRGEPATFPVNGVIKGWTEALQLMPVGSKWQLFVPASLAYGERGAGDAIGPNSTLIFEVELMSIAPKNAAK